MWWLWLSVVAGVAAGLVLRWSQQQGDVSRAWLREQERAEGQKGSCDSVAWQWPVRHPWQDDPQ